MIWYIKEDGSVETWDDHGSPPAYFVDTNSMLYHELWKINILNDNKNQIEVWFLS